MYIYAHAYTVKMCMHACSYISASACMYIRMHNKLQKNSQSSFGDTNSLTIVMAAGLCYSFMDVHCIASLYIIWFTMNVSRHQYIAM